MAISAVADFAGVSRAQMFAFLQGNKDITLGWLEKVAGALGVDAAKRQAL